MVTVRAEGLSFIEEKILGHMVSLVEREIPEARNIILFGSRARGDSDEDSDLDLAIVLDVPEVKREHWEKVWDLKWRVLEYLDAEEFPLSLILITLNDMMFRDSGIERELKNEGIVLWERN